MNINLRKQLVECQSAEKSREEKITTLVDEHSESKEQINYLSNKQKKCAHQKEVLQGRLVQIEQEGLDLLIRFLYIDLTRAGSHRIIRCGSQKVNSLSLKKKEGEFESWDPARVKVKW